MKLAFSKKSIDEAPKGYARISLVPEERGLRREKEADGVRTLVIGTGKSQDLTRRRFIILCRAIVRAARHAKAKKIALQFDRTPELWKALQSEIEGAEDVSALAAENFALANYEFTKFKTRPKEGFGEVEEILLCGKSSPAIEAAALRGLAIGEAVNACRDLANTPGGDMTPTVLAKAAKDAAKGLPISVKTLGEAEMKKLGMGALLGVAKGSSEKPTFTIMEYKGATGKPIVIAGKGVTFDSGGLNLKPSAHIYEMHMDMSGAAAAIYTVQLAARLKLRKRVIALIPSVENMPGNGAYRPGDVLRSLSGKTIEVGNTDAEGRLILADALTYAKRLEPAVVIDVATLTGAALAALGLYASALMTRDEKLAAALVDAGERSGDFLWPLPLWDEYEPAIKGTFADLTNVAMGAGARYGGAIEGGMFLWQFAKEIGAPWAHLDIAPRMTSAPGDELAKGAAGAPVRALIRFIEAWK